MKSTEEKLNKMSHVRMTEHERTGIRASLMRYALMHPYPTAHKSYSHLWSFTWQLALVIVFCVGATTGGVSFAASSTLPGDFLYPIKVHINEEVRGLIVSNSPEKKIEWQKARVEERVKEVEELVDTNKLTDAKKEVIEKNLKTQVNDFTKTASASANSSNTSTKAPETALRASMELEVTLKQHQIKLETAQAQNTAITAKAMTLSATAVSTTDGSLVQAVEESVQKLNEKTDRIISDRLGELDRALEEIEAQEETALPAEKPKKEVSPSTNTSIDASVTPPATLKKSQ